MGASDQEPERQGQDGKTGGGGKAPEDVAPLLIGRHVFVILDDCFIGGGIVVFEVAHHVHHIAEAVTEGGHGMGIVDQPQQTPDKKDHAHHRKGVGGQPQQAQIFFPPQPEGIAHRQNGDDHRFFQKLAKRIAHTHLLTSGFHTKSAQSRSFTVVLYHFQGFVSTVLLPPSGFLLKKRIKFTFFVNNTFVKEDI